MVLPLASQLPGLRAILGFDLLRQVPFTVDYAAQCIRMGSLPKGQPLPFVVAGDIRPTAWLETLGERFQAHLDTGSAQGVSLPLGWIQSHAPGLLGNETRRAILGDSVSARKFTLDRVVLGTLELGEVPAEAVSAEGGSFADQQRRWANVGNLLLQRLRLGVDGRRQVVVLERAEERVRPAEGGSKAHGVTDSLQAAGTPVRPDSTHAIPVRCGSMFRGGFWTPERRGSVGPSSFPRAGPS